MWDNNAQTFDTARSFERACVQAASEGALVLCATARLSRRLLHLLRMERIAQGQEGWETPRVMAFRGWVRESCETLWDARKPLSRCIALRLWHEAVTGMSVPEGLDIQPSLYRDFQSTFDGLMDRGLNPSGKKTGHSLADFRRAVTNRFLHLAEKKQFILWTGILQAVQDAIEQERMVPPQRVILAGFDDFSHLEENFISALADRTDVTLYRPSAELKEGAHVRVYATPEQECRAVCAEVLRVWSSGVKNLGVVFLDQSYFSLVKECFDDLAGQDRPDFEGEIRYNLAKGTPLIEHPLFRTAVLPLRILSEPVPGPFLASLFVSPYIEKTHDKWDLQVRSVLWANGSPLSLGKALDELDRAGYPMKPFHRLAAMKSARLMDWLAGLTACWKALHFSRFDEGEQRPRDVLAKKHLDEVVDELSREAGSVELDGQGALAWLSAAVENIVVSEKTSEITGIQVLNLIESRGLAFERLWVLGTHGTALPQPTREWPLLDPDERRVMDGGSAEFQWEVGCRCLASLCAAAPEIRFSRADSRGEESPFIPCPLILDEKASDNRPIQRTLDLWKEPPPEWARARWLREGRRAFLTHKKSTRKASDTLDHGLTGEWSVTALEDLVACPFRFFSSRLLRLEPLTLPGSGIDPLTRGQVIHAILKTFVDELELKVPNWPDDEGLAIAWLKESAERELSEYPDDLYWRVERIRLLGEKRSPGVLQVWLEAERARAREHWRFAGAEVVFKGLKIGGLSLSGRVDRVDCHDHEGFAVWDYKSGSLPDVSKTSMEGVQLPAYLLALKRGLVPGFKTGDEELRAGYISLKKAADVEVTFLKRDWPEWLFKWEENLVRRLKAPQKGLFEVEPSMVFGRVFRNKAGACEYCEFFNLCGYFDRQEADVNEVGPDV